jgi:hypothetical protein
MRLPTGLSATKYHESPRYQRSGNHPQYLPVGVSEVVVALNAGVMRRFERVVALPDPKILNFPSRHNTFA